MKTLMKVGKDLVMVPCRIKALRIIQIKKGHPVAYELNGQITAFNICLVKMIQNDKKIIGSVLSLRSG